MKNPGTGTFGMPFPCRDDRVNTGGRVYGIDTWLVHKFLQAIGNPPLRVVLWDGSEIVDHPSTPAVGMVIRDRAALWRLFTNPLLHFGDDYCAGRIEIEGGLVPFMETVYRATGANTQIPAHFRSSAYRRNQPKLNSLAGSRQNIHHHYDIGNDVLPALA